jgi:cytochrome b pre-mRNA-processing protein 3
MAVMKVKHLFRPRNASPEALYVAIVAGARQRQLYADLAVPDTLEGRLEMLVLHLFIVLERLKQAGNEALPQALVDAFFADVEANFREFGTSDQAVAKKMRKIEEIYYGRVKAYDGALGHPPEAMQEVLRRNVLGAQGDAAPLAGYARWQMERVKSMPIEQIERGETIFK